MRLFLFLAVIAATPAAAQTTPKPDRVSLGRAGEPSVRSVPGQPQPVVIAEPVAMMIAGFDTDGDARVTRAEFDAGLRRSFDSMDPARKGSLGYIAFSDWAERWLGDRNTLPSPFESDRDGDNQVSFAELAARFELFFQRFDADKDGVLVRRELVTVRALPMPPGNGKRKRGN